MKIGIMSMQRVENYGSFLQSYGLKKTLENMGHEVLLVDYQAEPSVVKEQPTTSRSGQLSKWKRLVRMLSPSYRAWRKKQMLMNRTFMDFCQRYNDEFLAELGVTAESVFLPEVDVLVVGSDEVFNCTQAGNKVGYSRQLFGKDHRAGKVISYAATFGTTTMDKLQFFGIKDEVETLLSQFSALSVRDRHSVEMIEQLCQKTPEQHIDPVLLYPFPEVEKIPIDKQGYMVVYAYADRLKPDEVKAIREFAAKKQLKVLSLGYYQSFCDEYVLASPLEVLAYVKHADYVVTDTFHGTVFSIKYQKQFATIVRESNMQKLTGLLKVFGLSDRAVSKTDEIESILRKPLSKTLDNDIQQERDKALSYLHQAINC